MVNALSICTEINYFRWPGTATNILLHHAWSFGRQYYLPANRIMTVFHHCLLPILSLLHFPPLYVLVVVSIFPHCRIAVPRHDVGTVKQAWHMLDQQTTCCNFRLSSVTKIDYSDCLLENLVIKHLIIG